MLVSVGGLAYAFGMRGILLLIVAFLGSGIISYFVLDRIRNNAGQQLGGFFHRINNRIDAATRAEDDDDELPDTAETTSAVTPGVSDAAGPATSAQSDGTAAEATDDTVATESDNRSN